MNRYPSAVYPETEHAAGFVVLMAGIFVGAFGASVIWAVCWMVWC